MLCPLSQTPENEAENKKIQTCNDIMQEMSDFIEKPWIYRFLNWHEYVSLKEQWKSIGMFNMDMK